VHEEPRDDENLDDENRHAEIGADENDDDRSKLAALRPTDETVEPIDIDNPDVVATARRKYGKGGSLLAAGMFGLDKLLADKKKAESVQIQEAPTDPVDVDTEGIQVQIDDILSVNAPPLERKPPIGLNKKKPRRSA
jgi:hypothetical protein